MKKIVSLALAMVMLLCSCGNVDSSSSNKDSSTSQSDNDSRSVGIDGTINGDCFSISIVDAKWTNSLETSIGTVTPEKEDSKLLCLVFSARNTTDETKNLGMFNAYVDKKAALPSVVVGGIDDAIVFVGAVAGGMEMEAYQVWELPEDWKEFQLNYFEATGPECKQYFVIHRDDVG